MALSTLRAPGRTELLDRLRTHFWLKAIGTTAFMTVFFVAYFAVLNHPLRPVTVMPVLAIDRWIGVQPWTLVFYVSLWIYVPGVPAVLRDRRELIAFGWASGALAVAGLAIFLAWPSAVPTLEVDWSNYAGFDDLKEVDATGNACPSLHVAFAVFAALAAERLMRESGGRVRWRVASAVWALGIVYSTLATKQHVSFDVVAGAGFGVAAMLLWEVLRRRA